EPNLARDTNDNGILYYDRNENGFGEASERDFGEDYDKDGVFDRCEGLLREDRDCDGHLDNVNEDRNGDGILTFFEDIDHDGRLDRGTEDRNGNGILDDTPRPTSLYPYGHLVPWLPDLDYTIRQASGIVAGSYFRELEDERQRLAFRQDLSIYVPGRHGSHDLKVGWIAEREDFSRTTKPREIVSIPDDACTLRGRCEGGRLQRQPVMVRLPSELTIENEAAGMSAGLYVEDQFKPAPNLSLGLGLRRDRERTDSFGYSAFDPAAERATFDRLNALIGTE